MDLDFVLQRAARVAPTHWANAAKEAFQQCLLADLAQKGHLVNLAFIGGTALRILHRLPRYSEDMDFLWTGPRPKLEQIESMKADLARCLVKMGVFAHTSMTGIAPIGPVGNKEGCAINLAITSHKFPAAARSGLQITFEFDLTPPANFYPTSRLFSLAHRQVSIPTLDLPSLMAGKLHILLTRLDREKGRDWFDYIWYRRHGILPNTEQLQSALDQTAARPSALGAEFWMSGLRSRLPKVDWARVQRDVLPFLEERQDAASLSEQAIASETPWPDFASLSHGEIPSEVVADARQAALEGCEPAIELLRRLAPEPAKAQKKFPNEEDNTGPHSRQQRRL
jgi:hypothetical protein